MVLTATHRFFWRPVARAGRTPGQAGARTRRARTGKL